MQQCTDMLKLQDFPFPFHFAIDITFSYLEE